MTDEEGAQEPGWEKVPDGWGLAHAEDGSAYCYNPDTGESFWLADMGADEEDDGDESDESESSEESLDEEENEMLRQAQMRAEASRRQENLVGSDPYAYEGLGEDYDATPYVPVSVEKAEEHRAATTFQGGKAPLWSTTTNDFGSMGIGVTLYFRLVKYLAWITFFMSLLSIPPTLFNVHGTRIPSEEQDPLKLSLTTAGNLGSDDEDTQFLNTTTKDLFQCSALLASCNATRTTTVFGADFNALAVSYITTSCDFLYSLLFAAAMWWTHKRFLKFVTRIDDENITPSDYTVYVTHMPRDATEAEIRDHFSELFALQTADEGGADAAATTSDALRLQGPPSVASGGPSSGSARTLDHSLRGLGTGAPTLGSFLVQLPGTQVKPVEDTSNTQDPSYKGSWVADVGTVRPIGAALRIFLQAQAQFEALRQARAESKRVRSECERAGFDPETDSAAGADVAKAEKKVDAANYEVDQAVKDARALARARENECIGAFVTFNHRQSFLRAVARYGGSTSLFGRLFQPRHLRLRGRKPLRVVPATEPSDILWEHIDTHPANRALRRCIVVLAVFVLLLGSFVLIVFAQEQQTNFQSKIPNLSLCDKELPALYAGSYTNATSGASLERPSVFDRGTVDSACPKDALYAVYPNLDDSRYSFEACIQGQTTVDCPDADRPSAPRCPCLYPASTATCKTMACGDTEGDDLASAHKCQTFPASTVAGCYCLSALRKEVDEEGYITGSKNILEREGDMCEEWGRVYALARGMILATSAVVVLVNSLLESFLARTATFERHGSRSGQTMAIAVKTFLATFLNTAIISLVVNGNVPGWEFPIQGIGLLEGTHSDLTSSWYIEVGAGFVTTMLINAVVPTAGLIFHVLVVLPLRRRRKAPSAVTQRDLDQLYEGAEFDPGSRIPYILTTLFTCLLFSGGMPIMLPIACGTFTVTYWVEKWLILRHYQLPPAYDHTLPTYAVRTTPYALALHLTFSIWAYGNSDIYVSNLLNPSWIGTEAGVDASSVDSNYRQWQEQASGMDPFGLTERVVRNNVFPLVLILVGIPLFFLFLLIYRLVKEGAFDTTLRFFKCICSCFSKRRVYSLAGVRDETSLAEFSGLEARLPPYTGVYFDILKSEKERKRAAQRGGTSVRIKPLNGGPGQAVPGPSAPHGVRTEETLYETPNEGEGQGGSAVAPLPGSEQAPTEGEGQAGSVGAPLAEEEQKPTQEAVAAPLPPPPSGPRRRAPMLKQLKQLRRRRQEYVEYKLWPPVEEQASPPTAKTQEEGAEGQQLLSAGTGSGSDFGFPVREPPQRGWSTATQATSVSGRVAPPGRAGKPKFTWEVIRDKGFLHTYRLESNSRYRDAMAAAAEQNVEEVA